MYSGEAVLGHRRVEAYVVLRHVDLGPRVKDARVNFEAPDERWTQCAFDEREWGFLWHSARCAGRGARVRSLASGSAGLGHRFANGRGR